MIERVFCSLTSYSHYAPAFWVMRYGVNRKRKKNRGWIWFSVVFIHNQLDCSPVVRGHTSELFVQIVIENSWILFTAESGFQPSWTYPYTKFQQPARCHKFEMLYNGGQFSHLILNYNTETLKCVYFAWFCDIRPADALVLVIFLGYFFTKVSMF